MRNEDDVGGPQLPLESCYLWNQDLAPKTSIYATRTCSTEQQDVIKTSPR